jgi:NADH-quinone oxidoreductase subunit C
MMTFIRCSMPGRPLYIDGKKAGGVSRHRSRFHCCEGSFPRQLKTAALGARNVIDLVALGETVKTALPGAVTGSSVAFDQLTLGIDAAKVVEVVRYLRDDPGCRFVSFIDVTAVDYPGREKRFDVVYHLLSPTLNERIRLRAEASETTQVPSIIEVFPGADWFERECYDLYGVIFTGHPDMRRLLTDYGFDGHPLRKDFPLTGFVEVRYDDQEKRVVYEPVRLNQEFRKFDFLSPWEGADYPVLPGDEKRSGE